MYTNTSDTVVMFLIPNAREQIIRQNVYVRKISKETEQWNVYQKGLVRKKTVGAMTLMWVFFHINVLSHVSTYRSPYNNLKLYLEIGKAYKMFDDQYMEFDNATQHCTNLGAR